MSLTGWNFFGSIRCINLVTSDTKYNKSNKIFDKYGINVDYLRILKNQESKVRGCYESHLQCIKESYNKGDAYCLIFEDDIVDNSSGLTQEKLSHVIDFIKNNDIDLFFLGCSHELYTKKITKASPFILKGSSDSKHAYVISRNFMKYMIKQEYRGLSIDEIYKITDKCYSVFPSFFYTEGTGLLNKLPFINKTLLDKGQEWYVYNVNIPYMYLLILIILVLLILYYFSPKRKTLWLFIALFLVILSLWAFNDYYNKNEYKVKEGSSKEGSSKEKEGENSKEKEGESNSNEYNSNEYNSKEYNSKEKVEQINANKRMKNYNIDFENVKRK